MRIVTTRGAARCAVCHDDLDLLAVACAGCASVGHVECWAELGRCSTLGCARSGRAPRRIAAPGRLPAPHWLLDTYLVELLATVLVVGLVAAVVTVNVMGRRHSGPNRPAADMKAIADALDLYRVDCGRYPDTLDALWIRPPGARKWGPEPYLKEYPPKDPWGNEYQYVPSVGGGRPEITSWGADNGPGGDEEGTDLSSRTINDLGNGDYDLVR